MFRRFVCVTLLSAFLVATSVPAAGADPSGAKNATTIQATCNGQTVMVVVNGNGTYSPAHVIGSTKVFVPTAFNLTFTFTPAGGGTPRVDTETAHKAAPLQNLTTCTIPLQTLFSGPQGTATLQGTVAGFFTPRKH